MMFDPTVFDNIKVVIEGAIYDLDLKGELEVVDRKDIIDLASLKREYQVSIKNNFDQRTIEGIITLSMDIKNLSAELLRKDQLAGCMIKIQFNTTILEYNITCKKIEQKLKGIWGDYRPINQELSFMYGEENKQSFRNIITIEFDKLISEEHIDDLLEMIPYINETLNVLSEIIPN
ncbi:hypothetical protein [Litchfieldia salsa]|uniref:Group-specific protein n=1 Tax=Litchfieldia salsa TaxID=930152 RepID=A0A1H0TGN5_9BACI|nr:hypothetical protein [Litchfieldia salsa]SDP53223.1 hypothetical protein SAMN05216565_103515 [Litchfieldia salsa]